MKTTKEWREVKTISAKCPYCNSVIFNIVGPLFWPEVYCDNCGKTFALEAK